MKLGFMSAALPQWTLDQVVDWASTNKFETLELMCWPTGDANRRYAGVTHIDVLNLTKASAARVNALVKSHRLELSALGYYPNPMHPDAGHREQVIAHLKRVIEAAALLEVLVVSTFVGRDRTKTIEQSSERFRRRLASYRELRRRTWRAIGDRELSDDLQQRRMAWWRQPSPRTWNMAAHVRNHTAGKLRPMLRSISPRMANDRRCAGGQGVRLSNFSRSRERPADRSRTTLSEWDPIPRYGLASATADGSRRCAVAGVFLSTLLDGVRRSDLHRARRPRVRGLDGASSTRLSTRSRRVAAPGALRGETIRGARCIGRP